MPELRDALMLPHPDPAQDGTVWERLHRWVARTWNDLSDWFHHFHWPRGTGRWALWIGGGLGGTLVLFSFAFFLALHIYKPDLPFDGDLYTLNRPPAFTFVDAEGRTLGRRGAVTGERMTLDEMPPYLPAAFLAMEDRRFHDHGGIDYRGLMRALHANIQAGRIVQGGSTITQQLAKTIFLSRERTITRKLEEIAAAREIESRFSKTQILELYLNRIYLGSGAYGVDGAAHVYFGKSAKHVTLAEAAMLASLTKAPSVFSPRRDLAAARARASRVLRAMVDVGAISESEAQQARANPAAVFDRAQDSARNYFFDAAAEEAQRLVPPGAGDLVIRTTMDPRMQDAAHATIARVLDRSGGRSHAGQAALVAMSPDGAVRALVGGRDYAKSSFNRATQAHRQPGSAFKPFVYLAAFEGGLDPHTVRMDAPTEIGDYAPENYRRTFSGAMTLHSALVRSVNTIAVQLAMEVGPSSVAATASRLGIASPLGPYASLALGTSEVAPLELTAAYGSFATVGLRVEPYMVAEVRGRDGRVLYEHEPARQQRVVDAEKALWMNAILYDVVQSGTGGAARVPGREVAGKTGTTSDFKDAWFVGFSADLVTGVWVGNDDSSPMKNVTGSGLPSQIWAGFMRTALAGRRPLTIARAEPPPPFNLAFGDPWGLVPVGANGSAFFSEAGSAGARMPDEQNIGNWQYESEEDAVAYAPPTRRSRSQPTREDLPRVAQEEVDERPEERVVYAAPPRRPRAQPAHALSPRAVQEGDGAWVGAAGVPQASALQQPMRPQGNRLRAYRQNTPRPVNQPNYPPQNAAIAPPNTPPPADARAHVAPAGMSPQTDWSAPEPSHPAETFVRVQRTRALNPVPHDAVPAPPNMPPPEEFEDWPDEH